MSKKPMIDEDYVMVKLTCRDIATLRVVMACINQFNLLGACPKTTQKNGLELFERFDELWHKECLTSHKPCDRIKE